LNEFTKSQENRIDEVENAAFEFCKVLTENENLEWNISFIGEIADLAANVMAEHGYAVRYPFIEDDETSIADYITKNN